MDPTKRVNDLIVITDRLANLLERENEALRDRRSSVLHEILDEKVTLSRVYESRIMGLTKEHELLDEVDIELRERLKGLGEKTGRLMEENAMLLKIAIKANQTVVDLIAEAVKESSHKSGAYTATGASGKNSPRTVAQTVAISVNQTY